MSPTIWRKTEEVGTYVHLLQRQQRRYNHDIPNNNRKGSNQARRSIYIDQHWNYRRKLVKAQQAASQVSTEATQFSSTGSEPLEQPARTSNISRGGRILIEAINRWVHTRNGLHSPIRHTQNKTKNIYFFNLSISSQSQWRIWPFLAEWPLNEVQPQNKNKGIAPSLWEKAIGTWFDGFCTTIDPRSGHWP